MGPLPGESPLLVRLPGIWSLSPAFLSPAGALRDLSCIKRGRAAAWMWDGILDQDFG